MDLSTFYGWLGANSTSLADANQNNGMRDAALNAYIHLSQFTLLFLLITLISVVLAVYYYTGYNNDSGRHYHPKHWAYVGGGSTIAVFVFTLVIAWALQRPTGIEGLLMLEIKIAFANLLYAVALYLLVSLIWCNVPQLPTNAYRFLKL